ncbi:STE20:SPS1 proline alanine rich protein [Echinococcus multilocularis]|uniref:non-specific serine/threonine protein kinase n=1 Tax=Echinococcus multilocularis TaxID=6211 RepID=A0A068YIA4_ECHMU|nr:STE20:SPS1 proline alanine rich protein [Echinococcus multilocularis]
MSMPSINLAASSEANVQWPVTRTAYEIVKSIGQGATSVVHEALCKPLNRRCAMKIINLDKSSTSASLEEINREIKSMKNMKNENIVAYHASFVDKTELCIVMDLCQRGSLLDVIKFIQSKRDITYGVFDEYTIATILRDVLRGLAYIHEGGLVHRDLKCGNLLVKDDGVIQIADFGVAGFLASQPLSETGSIGPRRFTFVGTPCWMAPEVMQQTGGYNHKADIWSIGITTIEMATGQAPYAKYAPMKVLMLTLKNEPPDIDTVATVSNQYVEYGHKFRKFTRSCLTKDPNQRPTARELFSHSYIKSKAKDRELLCRVLLSGEVPTPPLKQNRHHEDRLEKRDKQNVSTEWNFDTLGRQTSPGHYYTSDDDSDEGGQGGYNNENTTIPSGSAAVPPPPPPRSGSLISGMSPTQPPPVPAGTPASPQTNHPNFGHITNFSHQGGGEQGGSFEPTGPYYRLTLRKRNPRQRNELQDISFNYVLGKGEFKNSADVLARELVEADLLDGCDLLLVAHHMSELVAHPNEREHCFPLNSPPAPGQVPVESELHGYAKILIRLVDGSAHAFKFKFAVSLPPITERACLSPLFCPCTPPMIFSISSCSSYVSQVV